MALVLLVPAGLTLGPKPVGLLDGWHALLVRGAVSAGALDLAPSRGEAEALANILMFVPLGLLLAAAVPRARAALLVVGLALLSLGVELAQLLLLSGREATLRDVALNSTGGLVGVVAGRLLLVPRGSRQAPQA